MGAFSTAEMAASRFCASRLEQVFENCFLGTERTILRGGVTEPLYSPAEQAGGIHHLYYREDFFASALHEVAHWCIAGKERRQLLDFGYWYAPEGRNAGEQSAFENVEIKPQALEWYFSQACGYTFRVSVDNFDPVTGALPDTSPFRQRVTAQAICWQQHRLPERGQQFFDALVKEFGTGLTPLQLEFAQEDID